MTTVVHPIRTTHRWLALTVLALAQFLVVLDASIVNIALPALGEQLGLGTASLAWVITAYVLPFGSLLLLGGRLSDRFGHRRLFLIGTAGFVVASVLAGLSLSGGMLLGARALQGASAALLAPAALALLTQLFPAPQDRARALGVWGGVAGIGSVAGVLLGGVLTATWGWQWVFFVNVPVGVIVLAAVPVLISRDAASVRVPLDIPGAVTITGALVAVVAALSAVERTGFGPLPLALAIGALLLGAAFIAIERRTPHPLVPAAVFANRNLAVGNIVVLLVGGAVVALFFALSVYLQAVLGYDALQAGLSQLPLAGILVVTAGLVPLSITRLGTRPTLIGALLVLAAGIAWLAFAPADASFAAHLLGPTLLIGMGIGGALVTATQLAVDGVDGGESGLAGGLVNTSQQIGGALGLTLLAALASARTSAVAERAPSSGAALTAGFSWLFLGAAAFCLAAAAAVLLAGSARVKTG